MNSNYALVTGGSSGIGQASCIQLAELGFNVIINYYKNQEGAYDTKEQVEKMGKKAVLLRFDVSNSLSVKEVLGEWLRQNPENFIEVLVNNAGKRNDKLMIFMSDTDWEEIIDVNLNSFFYVTNMVLKGMILRKKGSIITISSMSGLKGWKGQVSYSASKAGLIGASKSLSKEVGHKNIRVNVLTPGFIKTGMTTHISEDKLKKSSALQRFGTEEEIGNVVAFLASEKSAYINGEVISINGGEQVPY